MSVIQWNESFHVGIEHLDNQHRKLVEMINELHTAMKKGEGKMIIQDILDKMTHYTLDHFKSEEVLFDQYVYPETGTHKQEHKAFVEKVANFKTKFDKGDIFLSIEVIMFLQEWLINHIKGSDKKYTSFLNSKGVR